MEKSYTIENLETALSVINFENMDSTSEIQLAAEIGHLLLERNTALEELLEKNKQLIAEQQAEIDKLSCQSSKLQEANGSCMKISEQLEQNILDLERSNQKLLRQRSLDQDVLKELKQRKEFLEQRCDVLQESQEFYEEKLQKVQIKMEEQEKKRKLCYNSKTDLSVIECESELVKESYSVVNKTDENIIDRIGYLSTNLSDCRCEVATYHERIERMEKQIALLLQKNMELEDVISSKKSKSRTTTSGCSSDKYKNSASLLEEIEAANVYSSMDSFSGGCFITSTPPKTTNIKTAEQLNALNHQEESERTRNTTSSRMDNNSVQYPTVKRATKAIRKQTLSRDIENWRNQASLSQELGPVELITSEQQVRINLCIEIDPPISESTRNDRKHVCRHRRLRSLAQSIVTAYKNTLIKGLNKLFRPLITHPQNYLATLVLWSNRNYIEENIMMV